jgi:hypothetical protein
MIPHYALFFRDFDIFLLTRSQQISDDEMTAKLVGLQGPEHDGSVAKAIYQYWKSWGIRGENSEGYAQYLGYLSGRELYPGLKVTSFEEYIKEHMK